MSISFQFCPSALRRGHESSDSTHPPRCGDGGDEGSKGAVCLHATPEPTRTAYRIRRKERTRARRKQMGEELEESPIAARPKAGKSSILHGKLNAVHGVQSQYKIELWGRGYKAKQQSEFSLKAKKRSSQASWKHAAWELLSPDLRCFCKHHCGKLCFHTRVLVDHGL